VNTSNMLGIKPRETFADVLNRNRGVGAGFDLLRILLAVVLFIGHTKWIAGVPSFGVVMATVTPALQSEIAANPGKWIGWTQPIKQALVPAFFALSGFLVMGSAFRLRSTPTFLAHRLLRIFPALIVEVTLSAFVLGSLLTTLDLHSYFASPEFWRYMLNTVGIITFKLPGVFQSNPLSAVNVNLWTLPSEFHCYLITAVLLAIGLIYDKKLFTVAFVVATAVLAIWHYRTGASTPYGPYPPHVVVYYFFVGVLFFHYQSHIPARFSIFLVCLLISYLALGDADLVYVAPLALTYCTLFFGLVHFPKSRLLSSGDYSYGVYLYGFPIAQAWLCVVPGFRNYPTAFTVIALTTTFLFAVLSWHLIEKRCLALKRKLPASLFPQARREDKPVVQSVAS
jgi:peptidoglycan/LPS O-acetylase OafA/YrhL